MLPAVNAKEVARLIEETREDDARMTPGTWEAPGGWLKGSVTTGDITIDNDARVVVTGNPNFGNKDADCEAIARLRNNARALADQLEAQQKEIERLGAEHDRARRQIDRMIADEDKAVDRAVDDLVRERDQLRAYNFGFQSEIERLKADLRCKRRVLSDFDEVAERDQLRAEVARLTIAAQQSRSGVAEELQELELMRPVVEAAVRIAKLDEICEAHFGLDDDVGQRAESELSAAINNRNDAVTAYRAAKEKAVIRLTIEISRDQEHPGQWTSHCIELDVISAGRTPHHALEAVAEAVRMTVEWRAKRDGATDVQTFAALERDATEKP